MVIRLAVIGGGTMGKTHATAIARCPDAELAAVCDVDGDVLEAFASGNWGSPFIEGGEHLSELPGFDPELVTDNPADVFESSVDGIAICTPNAFHAPYALDALDAEKHVLVEKPMAIDATECQEMCDLAKATDRALMVGHMWRYHEHVEWARSLIESGEIGEPVKAKGFGVHAHWGPDGWFADPDLAGGGALLDMGIHAIDTVGHLFGDAVPERVYASVGTSFGDYAVDDDALLHVTYEDGQTAIIESGWNHPHAEGYESAVRLYGTDGYVSVFPTEAELRKGGSPGRLAPELGPSGVTFDMFQALVDDFVDCIRTGEPERTNAGTAARAVAVADAAYESAETGHAVDVRSVGR